ncbi:MAG: PH domain-containing protein [Deltaproteobacteria bacterium]|nr:PH domain-containing protein [Deltaproteobacteria bacterium]
MARYPNIGTLLEKSAQDGGKNVELFTVHRSLLSIMSNTLAFLAALVVVFIINRFKPDLNLLGLISRSWYVPGEWLYLIPFGILLEIARKYHDDLYTFYLYTVTCQSGLLSLTYTMPNIRYVDIRAIEVVQDVMGRIFNYGDIKLDTAAQDTFEVFIEGVRAPRQLAMLVEELRQHSIRTLGSGAAAGASTAETFGD